MYMSKATGGDRLPLIRRTGWGIAIAGVLALTMASGASAGEPEGSTTGPGAVFDSLDAAAIDALMFAHRTLRLGQGQGGAIFVTDNGFSYGPTVRATRKGFRLTLRPSDVAWFYAHNYKLPTVGGRDPRIPTTSDRSMVSLVDPSHRPLYLLTSGMEVIRYNGTKSHVVRPGNVTVEDVIAANRVR